MRFSCFSCGEPLPPNSIKCSKCGYSPDIDFIKKCPNLQGAVCRLKGSLCGYMKPYQTCPTKNEAERESGY